ncbi:MAG: DUF2911 domain-containing protein [Candidatus Hydrogenedentales bacterium]
MNRDKHTIYRWLAAAVVTLCLFPATSAKAEYPIPSSLNVADVDPAYLGAWDITFTVEAAGRDVSMVLNILDFDGKVAAMLDSEMQPEPFAISSVEMIDDRLDLNSELSFGGFTIDININCILESDELVGTVRDSNDLLKADFRAGKLTQEQLDKIDAARPAPTEARLNIEDKRVRVIAAELEMGNSDWDLFNKMKEGEVHSYTLSGATKLLTDFDLQFGETLIKKENVAENYPGVYSLWLRKTEDGWNLIFNEQPDIWGTLRKAEHDVAEIPLAVSKAPALSEKFTVQLNRTPDGGILKMAWGDHVWSAPFKIVQ